MNKSIVSLALMLSVTVLVACGGGSPPTGTPSTAEPRAGVSKDVQLASDVDGEAIAFTVHEPTEFVEGARYPLILQGHGYGGSRVNSGSRPAAGGSSLFARLLDAGYGVISIDQRGHGQSGGQIRILDPEFEGLDLIKIIDWAEVELPWLAFRGDNLVLGAIGGSYGGGFQHVILAIDPKRRLDAIAPEITWFDLRYSLYSSNVFKSFWASLLSASGNGTSGGQDPEVNEGLARGLALNNLTPEQQQMLKNSSMVGFCENGQVPRVDALYWQSPGDTLFNFTETFDLFNCVSARGGDVRVLTKNSGHDTIVGGASGEACGTLDKVQSIVDWFDEKLKGRSGKANYIPRFCFHLDNSADDAVVSSGVPPITETVQIPAQTLIAEEGSPQVLSIPLTVIEAGGAVIAGVPVINLTVRDPLGLQQGDPIIFVTLARRAAGSSTDVELQANQVQPFRGYYDAVDERLIGVTNRLQEGDELRLLIYAAHADRYPGSGSPVATPVEIEAFVGLPLLPGNLPAPPSN